MILTDSEKVSCLRLMMTENIGPVTYNQLLSYYGTATKALSQIGELSHRGGKQKPIKPVSESQAMDQMETANRKNVRILFRQENDYPQLLRPLSDAAPILFVKGNMAVFEKKSVAIVGTRNASLNGKSLARKIAGDLATVGYNVVSGMAHGIDRAAHIGALSVGQEFATTAVLGGPVDEIYPQENQDIYQQISEHGCLVSEFPFGTTVLPRNFPRRNRIISGLSLGTLVIEAQERSGSLITAHAAAEQGRDVFAVPGSPVDPRSAGPNALIKEGATLVSSAQDIIDSLENIGHFSLKDTDENREYSSVPLDEDILKDARSLIWNSLSTDPISVDRLVSDTGLDIRAVNVILVELSLAGRLERHPGNRVSLIYPLE